jgi:hypothetical protein
MLKNYLQLVFCLLTFFKVQSVTAQENSPFSRYGLGDLVPAQNVISRGMGGLAIAYSDHGLGGLPFSINTVNPAALGNITKTKNFSNTLFDVGVEVDYRNLRSTSNGEKFLSKNLVVSYMQMAFPVSGKKWEKKGMSWGMAFGLKPIQRVGYKLQQARRIDGVDSILNLYEGSGGLQQLNWSNGFRIIGKGKNSNELCVGISTGYTFGNRNYSTKTIVENDSTQFFSSNVETQSNFGGVFFTLGIQYLINLSNGSCLRMGGIASLQQKMNARQSVLNQTIGFDYTGSEVVIDSIYYNNNNAGTVIYPMSLGYGLLYQSPSRQWTLGVEGEWMNWNAYRYFGNKDFTQDNWTLRAGAEYYPASGKSTATRFMQYIKYRTGFYYGPEYIRIGDTRNTYAVTTGVSIPLTTPRLVQTRGDFVQLNASIEAGARGNKSSYSFRETFTRINFGVSMNARWFQKRIYD